MITEREHDLTAQQLLEARQVLDVAAFNGILSLAIVLRKRSLLSDAEMGRFHDINEQATFAAGNASNRVEQDARQNLDQLFPVLMEHR